MFGVGETGGGRLRSEKLMRKKGVCNFLIFSSTSIYLGEF